MNSQWFILLVSFMFSLCLSPAFALKKSYVVYLGGHWHGHELTAEDLDRATNSHYELLGSYVGSERAKEAIFYSYTRHINGFAAILEEEEAEAISKHPKVISVFLNRGRKLDTTRSWEFLGLERDGNIGIASAWKKARYGEDSIIANLDTGVWPESHSFNDEGMGPIPSKWRGSCQNNTKTGVPCNKKLIGAKYFVKGYEAAVGGVPSEFHTARDVEGHGTHTLSTAGGRFVSGANVSGFGNGTAKGGSPKARVAAYKVCWPTTAQGQCFEADILAAIDEAMHDGVDVISMSLGGPAKDYFQDVISIGSFHAATKGILVVCSAGNAGPTPQTAGNLAPWIFTVAASTIDRSFVNTVTLGNKIHIKGQSLADKVLPKEKYYPLVDAAMARYSDVAVEKARLCVGQSLNPRLVNGSILVCIRGETSRVSKGSEAARAGAVGMILANDKKDQDQTMADRHVLPASHISYSDGRKVLSYIQSTKSPMAYMTQPRTQVGTKPAPSIAAFSSRGPNAITPGILKPDITAPGVNIIAATGTSFAMESGTSVSCPHISGIAGLLKTLHPDWSPAAIKSAIMTTASYRDNNDEPISINGSAKATPFDYGAGHVRPNRAMDPGLVYDLELNDYLLFLCAIGYDRYQLGNFSLQPYICLDTVTVVDFNYPSIVVPTLNDLFQRTRIVNVTRRVKNVGGPNVTYNAILKSPSPRIKVSIEPQTLKFDKILEEKKFTLTLQDLYKHKPNVTLGDAAAPDYVFGSLLWTDGKKHHVRSPIVVNLA